MLSMNAANVARLRVARAAVLVVPLRVILVDQADLAVRLDDRSGRRRRPAPRA